MVLLFGGTNSAGGAPIKQKMTTGSPFLQLNNFITRRKKKKKKKEKKFQYDVQSYSDQTNKLMISSKDKFIMGGYCFLIDVHKFLQIYIQLYIRVKTWFHQLIKESD